MVFKSKTGMFNRDEAYSTASLNLASLTAKAYGTDIMFISQCPSKNEKTVFSVSLVLTIEDAKMLIATLESEICVAESRKQGV